MLGTILVSIIISLLTTETDSLERDVNALLDQLGLDRSFFIELGIFFVLFFLLSHLYFKPFLHLFQLRHSRTVKDREEALHLMALAQAKLEEYQKALGEQRVKSKKEYEMALAEAKKEESKILTQAKEEAKKITQETVRVLTQQKEQLKRQLESEVEVMAQGISERLLSRKL